MQKDRTVGYIFMIVVGTILGWQTAFMQRVETGRAMPRFIAAGVLGAVLTGLLLTPLVTHGDLGSGTYTVDALLLTMAGALAALFACNVLYRRDLI
jgi:uncharacterized membrane protein YeaQ/YmgE (transglycosylase-associated protein family)